MVLRSVRYLLAIVFAFGCFAFIAKVETVSAQNVSCQAQGGACKDACFFDEDPLGLLDCPALQFCCKAKGLTPPAPSSGGTSAPAAGGGTNVGGGVAAPARIELPSCTKDGNCTLDQIVQTGVNFAKFLMGLSGALFFVIFIYGGAMYLLSFGDKGRVAKGRSAITGAAIGIVIVLASWTIVNFLTKALKGTATGTVSTTGSANACTAKGPGWTCTQLQGGNSQEALADGASKGLQCQTGFCPGGNNVLCCLPK